MNYKTEFPIKIFFGEDRSEDLKPLLFILTTLGHRVVGQASSGTDVLIQLKKIREDAPENMPDALWLDIGMEPGPHGGLDCAEEAFRRFDGLRSVFYTGTSNRELIEDVSAREYTITVIIKGSPAAQNYVALGRIRRDRTDRQERGTIFTAATLLARPDEPNVYPALTRLTELAKSAQIRQFDAAQMLLRGNEEIKQLEEALRERREAFLRSLPKS